MPYTPGVACTLHVWLDPHFNRRPKPGYKKIVYRFREVRQLVHIQSIDFRALVIELVLLGLTMPE